MEIKIDDKELYELRKRNEELEKEIRLLKENGTKVNKLKEEIEDKAILLAETMHYQVMSSIFKKLGFDFNRYDYTNATIDYIYLKNNLGKSWWESERLEVKLSAHIYKDFKMAFLNMGVKPPNNKDE